MVFLTKHCVDKDISLPTYTRMQQTRHTYHKLSYLFKEQQFPIADIGCREMSTTKPSTTKKNEGRIGMHAIDNPEVRNKPATDKRTHDPCKEARESSYSKNVYSSFSDKALRR